MHAVGATYARPVALRAHTHTARADLDRCMAAASWDEGSRTLPAFRSQHGPYPPLSHFDGRGRPPGRISPRLHAWSLYAHACGSLLYSLRSSSLWISFFALCMLSLTPLPSPACTYHVPSPAVCFHLKCPGLQINKSSSKKLSISSFLHSKHVRAYTCSACDSMAKAAKEQLMCTATNGQPCGVKLCGKEWRQG
jgi:hypothetical protein